MWVLGLGFGFQGVGPNTPKPKELKSMSPVPGSDTGVEAWEAVQEAFVQGGFRV